MKRFISFLLVTLLIAGAFSATAAAAPADKLVSTSTEYLEDGSCVVTNVYENAIQPRTGKTGYKESTYYSANGNKIFIVTVSGNFSYVVGVSSAATSASATVSIYNANASFVSKNAYTSGASAYANGKVNYSGDTISRTVVLTCDKYGNLS